MEKVPTAEQILLYADAVAKAPATKRKIAAEALQKWIDGNLKSSEAEKYRTELNLEIQRDSIPSKGDLECAACVAACCYWWGCDGACIAVCNVTVCR